MTAYYTCTDCAIRWVESDGATCPGCARRGERSLADEMEEALARYERESGDAYDLLEDIAPGEDGHKGSVPCNAFRQACGLDSIYDYTERHTRADVAAVWRYAIELVRAQEADRRVAEVAAELDPVPEVVPLVPAPAAPSEPALPAAVQPWVDAVRAVWPEARVKRANDSDYEIAIQAQPASADGAWDAYVLECGAEAATPLAFGDDWCSSPADLVAALRKHIPAPAPKP